MALSARRMRKGELFDYLTEKVTLSEKETRSASVFLDKFAAELS